MNSDRPHFHHHVHRASSLALKNGERAEKYAERSDQFGSVREAMRFFLDTINVDVEDQARFFEEDLQRTLFDDLEGTA